jgi:hypothetical protein
MSFNIIFEMLPNRAILSSFKLLKLMTLLGFFVLLFFLYIDIMLACLLYSVLHGVTIHEDDFNFNN